MVSLVNSTNLKKIIIIPILCNLWQKTENKIENWQLIYKFSITLIQKPDISRKLQTDIPHEHRHKHPQSDINKWNPAIQIRQNIITSEVYPRIQGCFNIQKLVIAIHYINKLKKKIQWPSPTCKKVFDKKSIWRELNYPDKGPLQKHLH